MAYVKIIYQNSPSTATPINAENLNHMDDGIAENDRRLNELATAGVVNTFNGRTGNVTSEKGDYDIAQIAPTNGATEGQIPILTNVGTEEEPVLEFQMQDVPSSGHVIQNASGTDMAQEDAMQFPDSFVSDDNVNGRTVVENIKECQSTNLASMGDGIIITTDEEDIPIGEIEEDYVEVTADGEKTRAQLLTELNALIDWTKITENSYIKFGNDIYRVMVPSVKIFMTSAVSISILYETLLDLKNNLSQQFAISSSGNITFTDKSSNQPSNGTKITLYYGSSVATVNLQTDARHCMMSDGETSVESLLDSNVAIWNGAVANVTDSNAVTMVKPDGTEVSAVYTGMIILQTSTSQANTGSVYMVRSGYMTPVCEGASARAPRLVIEDSVIKVKLNSDTTGRGVRYTVIKYPS